MEAALRSAYYYVTGENPPADFYHYEAVRGLEGIKEATVSIAGNDLHIAVVQTLANTRKVIEDWKSGTKTYDYIEVMNCIGGCIGGGGQPKTTIPPNAELRQMRMDGLYDKDSAIPLRLSHENPDICMVYDEFYEKPLSSLAEELLHTSYESKSFMLGE